MTAWTQPFDISYFDPSPPPSPSHSSSPSPGTLPSHLLPISPPAPHRRAPHPPSWKPRRRRSRHLRMRSPAHSGLFTVCEVDESDSGMEPGRFSIRLTPSPSDMSLATLSSPDAPEDIESSSLSEESTGLATPSIELDDPFSFDADEAWNEEQVLREMRFEESGRYHAALRDINKPRRPPRLDLTFSSINNHTTNKVARHPFAAGYMIDQEDDLPTPRTRSSPVVRQLQPALPILAGDEWREKVLRTPRTPVDLSGVLQDLLSTCGESSDEDDRSRPTTLSFPLPPARSPSIELRTPVTPPPISRTLFPSTPTRTTTRELVKPNFKGDHSFLQAMSAGDPAMASPVSSISSGSASSGSSGSRGLPRRKGLPDQWMALRDSF
ncbi:hypothetical protein BCR39DRAFT_339045 [Naematelia encephala]|uniref:Uncharacterized protein n=1 Tax=Naematelia encephala TaxID=71784 RepID=A0A1Y2AP57_9TREE|nr:hypothetical protein BCR39DRAFT_339045 [Naematelia encephala]